MKVQVEEGGKEGRKARVAASCCWDKRSEWSSRADWSTNRTNMSSRMTAGVLAKMSGGRHLSTRAQMTRRLVRESEIPPQSSSERTVRLAGHGPWRMSRWSAVIVGGNGFNSKDLGSKYLLSLALHERLLFAGQSPGTFTSSRSCSLRFQRANDGSFTITRANNRGGVGMFIDCHQDHAISCLIHM